MAKKEEDKKPKNTPLKSGKVKGPKGTAGNPDAPKKKMKTTSGDSKRPLKDEKTKKNPPTESVDKNPKKNSAPKKTSDYADAVPEKKPESSRKEAAEQKKAASRKGNASGEKVELGDRENISDKSGSSSQKADKNKVQPEKKSKKAPQKMRRREPIKGISAEEKSKLPNSSFSEEAKKTLRETSAELADKFSLDKKTKIELEKLAKSFIPDSEHLKQGIDSVSNKIKPGSEVLKSLREKMFSAASNFAKTDEPTSEKTPVASLFSDYDIHLFKEGKHYHLYKKLGSHPMEFEGETGVYFAVWAPNANQVSVIGDFNHWEKRKNQMNPRQDGSGIWEIFLPKAKQGSVYKYFIQSRNGYEAEKGDPYAFLWETPPNTASVVWDLDYSWKDEKWLENRRKKIGKPQPVSVYELHVGSWRRVPEEGNRHLSYLELAEQLPAYLQEMGFTHVEFMPVMEHPFYGSWGYQITGYFAPSSRFGTPQEFMALIDALHQAGIGVLLDWVPSHFPSDLHGLHYFDGTFLYEHADPQKGFHPDWQSYIFNYGRNEVRSFLISNAIFWLDKFHADGLRVDAVASMLYLDYSRKQGEWQPNEYGGRENLEALSFLKEFNEVIYDQFPDILSVAEESTAWPMVSKPTYLGGLGFGMKWMMGWMHDTLAYFEKDSVHRKHHQNMITFSLNYAFSENFMLPLSHDEVVYGKQSLWNKMPGDSWNKFANLRTLFSYMYAHPGTKLLFMGGEFAQTEEWDHDSSLDWHLVQEQPNRKVQELLKRLNDLYKKEPALYENSFDSTGFEWIDIQDSQNSVMSFMRHGENPADDILVICNFTPVPRHNYRIGVPNSGTWKEILNSDSQEFGGSDVKNTEVLETKESPAHGKDFSIALTLPPLGVLYLKQRS